jgi:hypothetical protein
MQSGFNVHYVTSDGVCYEADQVCSLFNLWFIEGKGLHPNFKLGRETSIIHLRWLLNGYDTARYHPIYKSLLGSNGWTVYKALIVRRENA